MFIWGNRLGGYPFSPKGKMDGLLFVLIVPAPGLKPRKARVFRHTPSCGRGRLCLPEGKRSPPPATPSFRIEKTGQGNEGGEIKIL